VLVPLLRTRAAALAALLSGATMLLLMRLVPGGIAVLGAGVAGSAAGAWWTRHAQEPFSGNVAGATRGPG